MRSSKAMRSAGASVCRCAQASLHWPPALGARSCSLSNKLDVAVSAAAAAAAERDAASTERDSWKAKTADALAANRAYGAVIESMQAAETERQQQAAAIAERAGKLVAEAKVDAVNAWSARVRPTDGDEG